MIVGDSPPQYTTFTVSLHKCITAKSRSEVLDRTVTVPVDFRQLVLSHGYHYSQSLPFPSKFQLNFDMSIISANVNFKIDILCDHGSVFLNYSFLFVSFIYTVDFKSNTFHKIYPIPVYIFNDMVSNGHWLCKVKSRHSVEAALHELPLTWLWNKMRICDVNPELMNAYV